MAVPINYHEIITGLKERIRSARLKAAVLVNTELLKVYWEIGNTILNQQKVEGWGAKVIERLAVDLKTEFPDFKGLSTRNLKYMRTFAETWPQFGQDGLAQNKGAENQSDRIVQAQLAQLPWYHHITLLDKVKTQEQRIFYIRKALENGWSRDVMVHQIETSHFERAGKAITNFKSTLPVIQSDLAQQTIKNPYVFDFLGYAEDMREAELEKGLVQHMKKFMLELGKGFAWVGSQKNLVVEGDDFFLDLLFFNYHMNCFVVFELKIGEFKPEFAGKLNFYVNTIDEQLKLDHHNPTIGILLCKTPNETVIKYSLQGIESPIGVSSYQFEKALPANLKGELPTVEELEKEIEQGFKELKNPVEKRIEKLKELIANIKDRDVDMVRTDEKAKRLFETTGNNLFSKMQPILKKTSPWFREMEITIRVNGNPFNRFEEAIEFVQKSERYSIWSYEISVKHIGFKKSTVRSFNCWSEIRIDFKELKYIFNVRLENSNLAIEKLYNEVLAEAEENELIDKWSDGLLNEISKEIEKLEKN